MSSFYYFSDVHQRASRQVTASQILLNLRLEEALLLLLFGKPVIRTHEHRRYLAEIVFKLSYANQDHILADDPTSHAPVRQSLFVQSADFVTKRHKSFEILQE